MPGPVIGAPFNPHVSACGFWPEDIVDRQTNLGDGPKRAYRKLKSHSGKNGRCFPSQATLAAELGKGERQVRRDIAELEAAGLIASRTRDGRRSNTYDFLWHAMFDQTCVTAQTRDLSGQGCPVNQSFSSAAEPNLSARDRTDMTGVTGQGCPTETFSESQEPENKLQAAAGSLGRQGVSPYAFRKPPVAARRDSGSALDSTPNLAGLQDEEAVEGYSEMASLLAKRNVKVRSGEIRLLIESGRGQGLSLEGVFGFVEDKLKQKEQQSDPVYSAKFLIAAIQDPTDLRRWMAKAHRYRGYFEQPKKAPELPFSVQALRAHLASGAHALRALPQYSEITAELDVLTADTDIQFRDLETLDHRLTELEERIAAIALAEKSQSELAEMKRDLDSQLRPYREKMTGEQLAMLERQYVERWLFESTGLPRLGLLYVRSSGIAA